MKGVFGHLCAHVGKTATGEPLEDGEINEMTLLSWHRFQNSNPGGLRPSTLPPGRRGSPQYWIFTSEWGRNIVFHWNAGAGFEFAISNFQTGSSSTTALGPLPSRFNKPHILTIYNKGMKAMAHTYTFSIILMNYSSSQLNHAQWI